jgi:hypothetical protein
LAQKAAEQARQDTLAQQGIENKLASDRLASERELGLGNLLRPTETGGALTPDQIQQIQQQGGATGQPGAPNQNPLRPPVTPDNVLPYDDENFSNSLESLQTSNIDSMTPEQAQQTAFRLGITPGQLQQYIDSNANQSFMFFDSPNPFNTSNRAARLRRLEFAKKLAQKMAGAGQQTPGVGAGSPPPLF